MTSAMAPSCRSGFTTCSSARPNRKTCTMTEERAQAERPEFVSEVQTDFGVVVKPLTTWEKIYNNPVVRKSAVLATLAIIWELYARKVDNPLLFPTFSATVVALWQGIASGVIPQRTFFSMKLLLQGYLAGLVLAGLLTAFATATRIGTDLLETLSSMLNPLPAIALQTLRMVGRNYGLSGPRYVGLILIPAAFPQILTGLKIGWAFAWRTLIAAELVFGVSQGSGGLGWYIFENKNLLETAN